MQVVLRKVGEGLGMKSTGGTFRKYSSAGVDWASWFLGIGLGLTLALQATTMRKSDISSVYAVVASVSRLAALTGTFFAVVGIFLIARIPWVERGVGHDRLVTWHRKLGPWSLYLIGAHVLFIVVSSAGQDGVMLVVEMWRMVNSMAWMWPALAGFILMVLMRRSGLVEKSLLNTLFGQSIAMMAQPGLMVRIRGIEYGKIGAWRRPVGLQVKVWLLKPKLFSCHR